MRWLLLTLGGLFAALAVAGLMLPLLPCTPFALLSAACFGRSSPAASRWLHQSRLLGPVLSDWRRHRGFRRATKLRLAGLAMAAAVLAIVLVPTMTTILVSSSATVFTLIAVAALPTVKTARA